MQIPAEAKTKTYRVLSDYFHLLKKWERNFKPKSMDEIDARYEEAVQNLPKVECQLDILLWGTEEEKEMLLRYWRMIRSSGGVICYNMMTDRNDIVKDLGWYRESPVLMDSDIDHIMLYLEENYSLTTEKKIKSAIQRNVKIS